MRERQPLVNVCSYPSAGNGGNNNPFYCIVNPGSGFLKIIKNAGSGVTSPTFGFTANPGAVTRSIAGSGTATAIPLTVTTSASVGETTIPSPWALNSASCVKSGGGSTGGALNTTTKTISSITIESGLITTCTFVDRIPTGTLTVIKAVTNDNGGTSIATNFSFTNGGAPMNFIQTSDTLHGEKIIPYAVGGGPIKRSRNSG